MSLTGSCSLLLLCERLPASSTGGEGGQTKIFKLGSFEPYHFRKVAILFAWLQGSFGPFEPKVEKKSENGFLGKWVPGGRKAEKEPKRVQKVKNSQVWTLF